MQFLSSSGSFWIGAIISRMDLSNATVALRPNTKAEPRVAARRPIGLPPCHMAGHIVEVAAASYAAPILG